MLHCGHGKKHDKHDIWSVCHVINLSQTWSVYFRLPALLWSKLPVASVITHLESQYNPSQDTAAVGDVNTIFVDIFETLYTRKRLWHNIVVKKEEDRLITMSIFSVRTVRGGENMRMNRLCSSSGWSIMSWDPAGTLQQKLPSLLSFLLSSYILLFRQVLICASKQISVAFGHRPPL